MKTASDRKWLSIIESYEYTRETPDFGGISLALRGSGACGAHLANHRLRRQWKIELGHMGVAESTAFGGVKKNINKFEVPVASFLGSPFFMALPNGF